MYTDLSDYCNICCIKPCFNRLWLEYKTPSCFMFLQSVLCYLPMPLFRTNLFDEEKENVLRASYIQCANHHGDHNNHLHFLFPWKLFIQSLRIVSQYAHNRYPHRGCSWVLWFQILIWFANIVRHVNNTIPTVNGILQQRTVQHYHFCNGIWHLTNIILYADIALPDNKFHGANMGPTWVLSASDGSHVGPMNLAIRVCLSPHLTLFVQDVTSSYR